MDWSTFFNSTAFTFIALPILIFCARIVDVSIGTMRVIFITKGYRFLAPLCGFFEVLIWLIAVTQIIQNLSQPFYYVAYAGGFAAGNFVGMMIESRMALGIVLVRIITRDDAADLVEHLKLENYGVTAVDADGLFGKVKILFTVTKRAELDKVVALIQQFNPQAFYTIEDVRLVSEPVRTSESLECTERQGRFRVARLGK